MNRTFKGFYGLLIACGLSLVMMTGCGGGGEGGSSSNQNAAILAPNAVPLDSTTMDNLSSVSADGVTLVFSSTTSQLESLKTDDVIIAGITSSAPRGLLRKVESIYRTADGTVQVTTSPATLTDAFEELHLKGYIDVDSGAAVPAKGVSRAASAIGIPKISYKIPGTDLSISGKFNAAASGNYSYSPILDYEIDIGWHIPKKCKFVLRGSATLDIDASINATAGVSVKNTMPLSTIPIYLGVIAIPTPPPAPPIIITFDFIPSVGIVLSAEDAFNVNFGFQASSVIAAGFDYSNGDTYIVSSFEDYHFNPSFTSNITATASAKLFFSPKIGMYLYDSAGIYVDPSPYGKFSSIYSISGNHIEAGPGISGNIGGELKFLSWSLAGINLEILDLYYPLWTSADTTPPTVSSTNPANNAPGVTVDSTITATFSEAMDGATINTATFMISNGSSNVAGTVTYSGTTATFTPYSNLAYSTTYTATITTGVKDSAGNTMANNYSWTFTTAAAPGSAPFSPTGVSATAGNGQVTISWNASTSATSYNIYWSTSPGVTKTTGTKVAGTTSPYTHTGLTNGTTYYYVVTAVNSYGESGESLQASATSQAQGSAPFPPTGVTATPGNGQVTISWNASTGATSYNIYWSATAGLTKINGTKITNVTSPSTHTGLTNGTTYYYMVTAVNGYGESNESSQVSATPTTGTTTGAVSLPKTGQSTCYDAAGAVITCTTTGQDGELQKGVAWPSPRFTVDGTGLCVTDNLTGLMWVQAPDSATRTWANALTYANGLSLCGYDDWRLPNVNEIESLINAEQTNIATWLNTQGFSNVQANYYWSSSTCAHYTTSGWSVDMWYGYVNADGKASTHYVWPVRAGQ